MSSADSITQRKLDAHEDENIDEFEARPLSHIKSATGVTISLELFEKLCLTPKPDNDVFRKEFANPTPLGFMGLVISALTFSAVLMGWGGATSLVGVVGIFYFTGPLLLILSTIFEWAMGNFFPMMVMGMFSVFWLSFGVLYTPTLKIAASYSPTGDSTAGAASVGYNAAIALYLMVWGFWLFTVFIFTLKTNMIFAMIFFFGFSSSFVLGSAYWMASVGDHVMAIALQKAGAALFFAVGILGYYITVVMIAAEMGMTAKLPVGDLSHLWAKADIESAELEGQ